ncbi:hypothetical protein RO21_07010 [[Actinobacillus] muris]|uniref:Sulfurtransferase complex subunit TusB n=1 Tax=Muribacter muris TaxID=67855 RepID=A0A0J5S3E2_9PAST|nr:DsrH/TusB family sulfur metabolism protein [Muribacter muris]KMK51302.1 hypothetical protein RO21_07010 [[Actinobacillus] muris] [Muribacter muris]
MLYTFSQAHYDPHDLHRLLANITETDAVLLWQNGVLQAVKSPALFAKIPNLFILENDLNARGLRTDFPVISLAEAVSLTERYFPQIAL